MKIIKFDLSHSGQLRSLERECFPADHWEDEIWQEVWGEPERNEIYLAVEQEKLAAFLMVYNWGSDRNYVKITNIGTKPGFRGRGLAHDLMEAMLAEMKSRGMDAFVGETRVSNHAMQKIFRDFGFRVTETVEGYYDHPDEDALRYRLVLEG